MADLFAPTSDALFSPCERYRYLLRRQLTATGGRVCLFVMLNPSTADATANDPTIRRCIKFAGRWGYDWLHVANLFAWRATDPADMRAAADPIGPDNNKNLRSAFAAADLVVCAWGKHGSHQSRSFAVCERLTPYRDLHCLAMNQDGSPKHPLYVRNDTTLTLWKHPRG